MEKRKLLEIEEYLLDLFRRARKSKLLARDIFAGTARYANADLVRAFEDLEKRERLLVRFTEEGDDWVQLTPAGAALAGLSEGETEDAPAPQPHPPKSAT